MIYLLSQGGVTNIIKTHESTIETKSQHHIHDQKTYDTISNHLHDNWQIQILILVVFSSLSRASSKMLSKIVGK